MNDENRPWICSTRISTRHGVCECGHASGHHVVHGEVIVCELCTSLGYVEERDSLRDLLLRARVRLDQYIGMCKCPGEACVSACRECNTTQELVNIIRAFMQRRTT